MKKLHGVVTRTIRIGVTQKHIDDAVRGDSGHCMIAEAIKDASPQGMRLGRIAVDVQTIRFTDLLTAIRYVYLTPPIAQLCLVRFDRGKDFTPFAFRLHRDRAVQVVTHSHEPVSLEVNVCNSKKRKKTVVNRRPKITGGQTPPRGALAHGGHFQGKRRQFGIRALDFSDGNDDTASSSSVVTK